MEIDCVMKEDPGDHWRRMILVIAGIRSWCSLEKEDGGNHRRKKVLLFSGGGGSW
jgi:hypothetical protein